MATLFCSISSLQPSWNHLGHLFYPPYSGGTWIPLQLDSRHCRSCGGRRDLDPVSVFLEAGKSDLSILIAESSWQLFLELA